MSLSFGSKFLLLLMLLVAVSPRAMAGNLERGGTLRVLLDSEPPSLALTAPTGAALNVATKVIQGLVNYGKDLKPIPELATAWTVSPDAKRFTFTLRQGVLWHDGEAFTAADVAFSLKTIAGTTAAGRIVIKDLEDVETPDDHTVIVVLSEPAPYLIHSLQAANIPILPKHVYEKGPPAANPANNAPIGTGPFMFQEWVHGSHIILVRNPHYWEAGKPRSDRLVFRFIADAAARAAAFEAGEVDIGTETTVPRSDLPRLRKVPGLTVTSERADPGNALLARIEFNLDNPFFKDVRVRQAVAHALDREQLLKLVWYGGGELAEGPLAPASGHFHGRELPVYAYDLHKAEQLLEEAGFPRGADGTRFAVTFDYVPVGDAFRRLADVVKSALARIGIKVTIRSQDFPGYIKRLYTDRAFDFVGSSVNVNTDPVIGSQRFYASDNIEKGVPFSNASGYRSTEADRLLKAAAVETNEERRAELYQQFQVVTARDLPILPLLFPSNYTIASAKVHSFDESLGGFAKGNLADAYRSAE